MMSIDPAHNGYTAEQMPLLLKRLHERVAGAAGGEVGGVDGQGAAFVLWAGK